MQASTSGFFVHVTHDHSDSTDLRLADAEVLLAQLTAAVADVQRSHAALANGATTSTEAEANPDSEETKAAAAEEEHAKRVEAGKKAAETRAKNEAAQEKTLAAKKPTSRRGKK